MLHLEEIEMKFDAISELRKGIEEPLKAFLGPVLQKLLPMLGLDMVSGGMDGDYDDQGASTQVLSFMVDGKKADDNYRASEPWSILESHLPILREEEPEEPYNVSLDEELLGLVLAATGLDQAGFGTFRELMARDYRAFNFVLAPDGEIESFGIEIL